MQLYSIELTPSDVVAQQELFQREIADLLGCKSLTALPPFPDYSLLSQHPSPKILLKLVNEVVLSRRPAWSAEFGWLLLPLVQSEKILGVLFAENVEQGYQEARNLAALERLTKLCLDRLQLEKKGRHDEETLLWRREVLVKKLSHAIQSAENDGSLTSRRLLDHGPRVAHFDFICFSISPAPEPWAGPGSVWKKLGPQVAGTLPRQALAAHLGGGYMGIFWPKARIGDGGEWSEVLLRTLSSREGGKGDGDKRMNLSAGLVSFPEDFYDDGPVLPWEKSDIEVKLTGAEEVLRRAILAADLARKMNEDLLGYKDILERGLIRRESAIEKRLSSLFADAEPGALLLLKLDDWEVWQHQYGSKGAAQRANRVLAATKEESPSTALVDWADSHRFGLYLPGEGVEFAKELSSAIRRRVRSELGTTVQVGISVHPCPGFAKSEIVDNARKALVHTGFFGPNTQTVFDAVTLNISGDRLYESGRLQEAEQEFQRALVLDPGNINVRNSLGICYAQMGKLDHAVAEFSRASELEPNDFMAQYNLACALLNLGRTEEAERAFVQTINLEPANGAAYFHLAKVCNKQNRLAEALEYLNRTVELKPNWAKAWRVLGECLLAQQKATEAMDAFKQALRINGKDAAALSGLAILYGRTEPNLEIALSLARRSVELKPDDALFGQRLAELLWHNQEIEEASAQCERVAALAPHNEQIRRLREEIAAAQYESTS